MATFTPNVAPNSFQGIQAQIKADAIDTLKKYNNNRVVELGLATRSYKYDFPYDSSYNIKDSNYRFALLIERQLFNKVPHLENTDCMFWNKTRNHVIIYLKPSLLTTRYIGRIIRHCSANNFIWSNHVTINTQQLFSARGNRNNEVLRLMIDLSIPFWGTQGICKLFFNYPQIEKTLLSLQRLAFYEPTEIAQQTQSSQNQNTAVNTTYTTTYTTAGTTALNIS